jgi:hypothetical protein
MVTQAPDQALVADIARDVVKQVAPQEMPLFRAQSQAYFEHPARAPKSEDGRDELLGFGTGVEITLLTPVILQVTQEVLKLLAIELAKIATHDAAVSMDKRVRGLFRRFRGVGDDVAGASPPLTTAQLRDVRAVAFETACRLNVGAVQAGLLADAMVGALVVAPAGVSANA